MILFNIEYIENVLVKHTHIKYITNLYLCKML